MVSIVTKLRKNGFIVSAGLSISFAFRFIRNTSLAHLLTQSDYGVSVALSAVMVSATLATDLALDKMLVRERQIDDKALQNTVATVLLLRSFVSATILLIVAGPLARLLGAPQAATAFRLLSLAMAITGLFHLDTKRYQRDHRFLPDSIVFVSQDGLDCCFAVTAAYFFRTYYVVPVSAIAAAFMAMAVSHLLAERPFRLSWNEALARRALSYGMPLMLSGLIILLATQADRIVIGAAVGLKPLAIYGAAMTIIATPGLLAGRVLLSVPLPILADAAHDDAVFARRFRTLGVAIVIAAVAIFLPLMILGGDVIPLVFGQRYRPPADLSWIIAIGQAAALIRNWPNVGALALARTRNLVASNAPRLLGIASALVAVRFHVGIEPIAACFAAGEVAALLSAVMHFSHIKPGILTGLGSVWLVAGAVLAAGIASAIWLHSPILQMVISITLIVVFGAIVGMVSDDGRMLVAVGAQQLSFRKGKKGP